MPSRERTELDDTGKVVLDDIYNAPNPCKYYVTLSNNVNYQIPENARPFFQGLINDYRKFTGKQEIRILDVGCSYGINAMLLKCGISYNQLAEHYAEGHRLELKTSELIERDKALLQAKSINHDIEVIGLDRSSNAIEYGIRAGILDDGIDEDLENNMPSADAAQVLEDIDLIISSGCIGYVTAKTLKKVINLATAQKPWMAHCVLRMFPFAEIDRELQKLNYTSQKLEGSLMKQRRFANLPEQQEVIKRLHSLGIETSHLEDTGWFYANAYHSRPAK